MTTCRWCRAIEIGKCLKTSIRKIRADVIVSFVVAIVTGLATLYVVLILDPTSPQTKCAEKVILGLLALGVPLWFLCKYAYKANNDMDKIALENLKYGQELARNFWLALIAVLAFVFDLIKWPG